MICGKQPPLNLLSTFRLSDLLPGLAHIGYWSDDKRTQRYILGRTYGYDYLRDMEVTPFPRSKRLLMSLFGYFFWALLLVGMTWAIIEWGPDLVKYLIDSMKLN